MRAIKRLLPALLCLLLFSGCTGSGSGYAPGEVKLRDTASLGKKTTFHLLTVEPMQVGRTADLTVSESWRLNKDVRSDGGTYRLKTLCVKRNQTVMAGEPVAVLQGTGSISDAELKELEIASYVSGQQEMLEYYASLLEAARALPQRTTAERQERALRVEAAELDYAQYQLQSDYTLAGMKAALEALYAAAGETVLYAPMNGTVYSVTRLKEGELVEPGSVLCSIHGEDGLRFSALSSSGVFVYGREVSISMGRTGRTKSFTGRVVSSPEVAVSYGGNNTTIVMEIDADPAELPAAEGTAELSFTLLADVFAVPKNAITNLEGISYVDVLVGDTVCRRSVVKGPQAGSYVAILQGLNAGDQVVLSSYNS